MYKVLLVDDEMPALRFMQAIIEKHAPHFTMAQSCTSGEDALAYLQQHKVSLLLTDISMPGMDGIALSLQARALYPDLHIVIISGYAEFEYAKGAIQAAVDDYILKPVSLSHMKEVLSKMKNKLDLEKSAKEPTLLSALLSGQPYDQEQCAELFGGGKNHFALVRWGNLPFPQGELRTTAQAALPGMPFGALYGRDDDEQLFFAPSDQPAVDFQSAVKVYVAQRKNATWTILFSRSADSFQALPAFFHQASRLMERTVVIGRRQFVFLTNAAPSPDSPHIPGSAIRKLELFIQDNNSKMIKDLFVSLAVDWEKRQLPQLFAAGMVQQLVHLTLAAKPALSPQQDMIMRESYDLLRYAVSYGDLMAGLYSVLFDDNLLKDKKRTAEDLYAYAVRYIQEKYAQPINIQHVCAEIGISQTYLSRLFRKYGDSSFNSFLTKCRMDNARAMIQEHPDLPLRQVASCVGYEDYAYFSKVFHQAEGCSPSQYLALLSHQ